MPLLSSRTFSKPQSKDLGNLVLEGLRREGLDLSIVSFLIEAPGGVKVYAEIGVLDPSGIVYLKAGDCLILDSRIKPFLEEEGRQEELKNIIFLNEFRAFLNNPNNLLYTLTEITAINSLNLKGKNVLDLGCAEGVLGLLALRKGANSVYGIDMNKGVVEDFEANLKLNSVPLEKSILLTTSFNNQKKIFGSLPMEAVDIVFANIGPHFESSDLEALSLLKFLPKAQRVIGAGYNLEVDLLRPTRALFLLSRYGFKENLKYFTSENEAHAAFIIEK